MRDDCKPKTCLHTMCQSHCQAWHKVQWCSNGTFDAASCLLKNVDNCMSAKCVICNHADCYTYAYAFFCPCSTYLNSWLLLSCSKTHDFSMSTTCTITVTVSTCRHGIGPQQAVEMMGTLGRQPACSISSSVCCTLATCFW